MSLISPAIDIVLISAVLVAVSRVLEAKIGNKKKMKESQQRMKEKQKQIKELAKRDDEKSKQEAQKLQQEMLQEMGESMQGSMRYMMISMPIFLVVFLFLGAAYGSTTLEALFPLPKFSGFFLLNPLTWIPVDFTTTTGWLKWYFFSYLIISIIVGIVWRAVEKTRGKKNA